MSIRTAEIIDVPSRPEPSQLVGVQGSVNTSSGCAADSLSTALPSEA
jgi:hypothetical protein